MILGFTGTQHGMTRVQLVSVKGVFQYLGLTELHHGECKGADGQANDIAMDVGARRVGHPPIDRKKWVFCSVDESRPAKPYLKRNREIVQDGLDGLVAAPAGVIEPTSLRGQGTWTTIGYARKAGRHIWIVFPDGSIKEEQHNVTKETT